MSRSPPLYPAIWIVIASIALHIESSVAFSSIRPLIRVPTNSLELHAKKPTVSGVGGLSFKPAASEKSPIKTTTFKKSTTSVKKPVPKVTANAKKISGAKPTKNGTSKSVFEQPKLSNDTPWSSILIAFLNPLRNPNSLFLYLLVIVSVLGKLNENN